MTIPGTVDGRADAAPAPATARSRGPRGSMRRATFAALVVMVLGIGLVGQLLLNTSLGQGAFALHDLQQESADLAETQQSLQQQLAWLQSPEELAERAQALGMVVSKNPVFLDLTDGQVQGVPVAATAPPPTTAPPTTPPPTTAPPATAPPTTAPPTTGATTPPATGAAR